MDVGENLGDRIGRNNAGKPVRAQEPAIADDRLAHGFIGGDIGLGITQNAHDDVALRMVFGLFRGDLAAINQILNERVVGGDLGQGIPAQKVCARVADVNHGELPTRTQDCNASRSQTCELGIMLRAFGEFFVSVHQGIAKEGE